MSRRSRSLLLVLLLTLGFHGGPILAADEPGSDSKSIVSDVVRMLEGGVSSRAVVEWLQRQETPIPPLTPDEMIQLSQTGASDDVIETLNRMTRAPRSTTPPPPVPVPVPARVQAPEIPTQGTDEDSAGVLLALKYKYPPDTGDQFSMLWRLFVYVDGRPVTYSRSQSSFMDQTIETFTRLEPGSHVIQLLHESHVKKGKKGYRHESQVCPEPIRFEVQPGDGWKLELTYLEKTFAKSGQGPLSWQLTKAGEPVDGRKLFGTRLERWPQLCDDMEANVPAGKKTPGWVKQNLKNCVNWASLSEGVEPWPDRSEILAELAQYDYKPPRD